MKKFKYRRSYYSLTENMKKDTRVLIFLMVFLLTIESVCFPIGAVANSKEIESEEANSYRAGDSQHFELEDSNYNDLLEDQLSLTSLFFTQGIQDDTEYYIANYNDYRMLGNQMLSDYNGANVHTNVLNSQIRYQWITEQQFDGSFKLINKESAVNSIGRVLYVDGDNVTLFSSFDTPLEKFTITRESTGEYSGLYLIQNDGRYVSQDPTTFNVYMTNTLSSNCYWSFVPMEKRYAEMFCFDYPIMMHGNTDHFQTDRSLMEFRNVFDAKGYFSWSYENNSASAAFSCLTDRDDVFVFIGHGSPGRICFYDNNGLITGSIVARPLVSCVGEKKIIGNLDDNALANTRMVLYLGCQTGAPHTSGYNLVDVTFDKGAHFVLGVTEIIYNTHMSDWLQYFLEAIDEGANIDTAIYVAQDIINAIQVTDENGVVHTYDPFPIYYKGDTNQYFV